MPVCSVGKDRYLEDQDEAVCDSEPTSPLGCMPVVIDLPLEACVKQVSESIKITALWQRNINVGWAHVNATPRHHAAGTEADALAAARPWIPKWYQMSIFVVYMVLLP